LPKGGKNSAAYQKEAVTPPNKEAGKSTQRPAHPKKGMGVRVSGKNLDKKNSIPKHTQKENLRSKRVPECVLKKLEEKNAPPGKRETPFKNI